MPKRRSKSRPGGRGRALAVALLGLLAAWAAVDLSCRVRGNDEVTSRRSGSGRRTETRAEPRERSSSNRRTREDDPAGVRAEPSSQGARIAVVIDDLGRSVDEIERIDAFGVPVSYAVLPYEEQTAAVVEKLGEEEREVLLHLPMEPEGTNDPGPGALRKAMTDDELIVATERALEAIPGAVGVNNHMGSGFSADRHAMRPVLALLAKRGLFYLDSRTSTKTVGYRMALDLGIPTAERQVFLDGAQSPEAIRVQWQRLLTLAEKRGAAIAIGHPHPTTFDVLDEEIPKAKAAGFEFVPVSYLLDRAGGPE